MNPQRLAWAQRLRHAATPVLRETPILSPSAAAPLKHAFIESFSDEAGHRRAIDPPFLASILGVQTDPAARSPRMPIAPEIELWNMLATGSPWRTPTWFHRDGPLTTDGITAPIEAWTETELSCLHALSAIAHRETFAELHARCENAARWFTREIQPDNATHHPWAIHTFIALWADHADVEARLYAETMLHNCMVSLGRPDRLSACILWHAASQLDQP